MLRVLLGIIKGAIVGGGIGFAASKVGLGGGVTGYLVYAAIGFVVGVVCGKPIWRQETLFTPALKGLFGAAILAGLYWLASKFLGGFVVPFALPAEFADSSKPVVQLPQLLGPALAILYGVFIEVDDGGDSKAKPAAPGPTAAT